MDRAPEEIRRDINVFVAAADKAAMVLGFKSTQKYLKDRADSQLGALFLAVEILTELAAAGYRIEQTEYVGRQL